MVLHTRFYTVGGFQGVSFLFRFSFPFLMRGGGKDIILFWVFEYYEHILDVGRSLYFCRLDGFFKVMLVLCSEKPVMVVVCSEKP